MQVYLVQIQVIQVSVIFLFIYHFFYREMFTPNPGPGYLSTPEDFKSRSGIGFIYLSIRSLLPKIDSESGLNQQILILLYSLKLG